MSREVNASSAGCTASRGSVNPSPVTFSTCSEMPPSTTSGRAVMLPSAPSNSMVPAPALVVTPVTKLPTSGMAPWIVSLMPSALQVMFATSEPMEPLEVAESSRRTSLMSRSTFMPCASRIWLPAVSIRMFV